MTKLEELYAKARLGDIEAKNTLFYKTYPLIKRNSEYVYNEIKLRLLKYYHIINVPNSILEYEDILQDMSIKVYELIEYYLQKNSKIYLSTYLQNLLNHSLNKIISSRVSEIISRNNLCINKEINFQYRDYDEDKLLISEIRRVIKDPIFKNHFDFICDIFNGYTYQELAKKYHLVQKGIGVKIKLIAKLYQDYIKKEEALGSEENLRVSAFCKLYLDDIKNGNLYNIPYFSKILIFSIHDVYVKLKDDYFVNYDTIKNDYCTNLYKYLNGKDDEFNTNIINIIKSFNEMYLSYKKVELDYIRSCDYNNYMLDNCFIDKLDVLSLIITGHVYSMYPYSEYINMDIEEIYTKLSSSSYTNNYIIRSEYKIIINKIIEQYFIKYEFDIDKFNIYFKKVLEDKKLEYLNNKINNKNLK